ncbi:MAG: M14 family murein peptide amidase A [Gammaproteobacteria bacterium]|nr:M14 family murein peptide amidase A [Gammaproteobacteria bacterium]
MRVKLAWLLLWCGLPIHAWASDAPSITAVDAPLNQLPPLVTVPSTAPNSALELCLEITEKLRSVTQRDCEVRSYRSGTGSSVRGRPLIYTDYEPVEGREPLGRVMLLGGIHGDEYSSVSIVFRWMEKLDEHHSGLFHWRVAPLVNPDGLLRAKSQRMNENGVDLNRNFPTHDWDRQASYYWETKMQRNPRRYPGKAALSEPESRWLADEIARFQPDVIVSVHAPYGILDFDGPREAPKHLGQLHLSLLGTYPGSLGNYAGVQNAIPVVTIELPYAGIMPTPNQISAIWVDLVRWLTNNVNAPPETSKMASREHIEH